MLQLTKLETKIANPLHNNAPKNGSTTVKIKVLDRPDVDHYRIIRLESLRESPLAFSDGYEDLMVRPREEFFSEVAPIGNPPESFVLGAYVEKNQLAGFVRFTRDKRSKSRHIGNIKAIYILPEFRGFGIGDKLVQELISKAKLCHGLEQVHVWVYFSKSNSAGFFQRMAFKSSGNTIKGAIKHQDLYIDSECMILSL